MNFSIKILNAKFFFNYTFQTFCGKGMNDLILPVASNSDLYNSLVHV